VSRFLDFIFRFAYNKNMEKCTICGKEFASKRGLLIHAHTHKPANNQSIPATQESRMPQIEPEINFLQEVDTMGKRVESRYCPTCGKDYNEVKVWEVPERTVVDDSAVASLQKSIDELAKKLDFKETDKKLIDISAAVNTLTEALGSHPKPSEELFKIWENCPECKANWEKLKDSISSQIEPKMVKMVPEHISEHIEHCPECRTLWEAKLKQESKKESGLEWLWQK